MSIGTMDNPRPYNWAMRDINDNVAPQPCKVCEEPLRSYRDLCEHEERHVQEGTLVAYIGHPDMVVSFDSPEHWESVKDQDYMQKYVRLTFEQVDFSSNAARAVCQCGEFVYPRARRQADGSFIDTWVHYRMRSFPQLMSHGGYMADWARDGDTWESKDHTTNIALPRAEKETTS